MGMPCFMAMVNSQLPPNRLGELTTAFQSLTLLVVGVVELLVTEIFREDMIKVGKCAESADEIEPSTDYIWPFLASTICAYSGMYLWYTWLDTYIPDDFNETGVDASDVGLQYDKVTGEPIINLQITKRKEQTISPKFA